MLTSLYSLYTATVHRRSVIKNSFYHKLQRSHFYSRGGYNKKNSTTVAVTALSFNDYTESLKKAIPRLRELAPRWGRDHAT